jgi:eukaryotic-like serine/threonine-protein kinase
VHERARGGMISVRQNETRERDLSWLDFSRPQDLSNDGKVVLFTERGVGAGASPAVFVRSTDGSPAVRLGEGSAWALSPDGKWALATRTDPGQLVLLPTGAGQTRVFETGTLTAFDNGRWSPDGTRLVFNAREPGRSPRVYVQNVSSGGPTPITPEGVRMQGGSVSPDSKQVLAAGPGLSFALYPLGGGAPVTANGFGAGDAPIRWSGDGKSIWTVNETSGVPRIMRIDVATGRRDVWREIEYADPSGLLPSELRVAMSADGRNYVYGYLRSLSDLYVADGLK